MKRPKAPPAPEQVYTCSDCGKRYGFQCAPTYSGTRCPRCGAQAKEILEKRAEDAARQLDEAAADVLSYATSGWCISVGAV